MATQILGAGDAWIARKSNQTKLYTRFPFCEDSLRNRQALHAQVNVGHGLGHESVETQAAHGEGEGVASVCGPCQRRN